MPARAAYRTYTVVKGDTLADIAKRFGSSVGAIATASGVADPNKIKVGQQLLVPVAAGSAAADPDLDEVRVNVRPVSAPKSSPAEAARVVGLNPDLAEWLRPPKLWFTLAALASAGYYLLVEAPQRRRPRK
jgi:murein DD-endopeptidase MepM/ murein hydrolase activator NlpD